MRIALSTRVREDCLPFLQGLAGQELPLGLVQTDEGQLLFVDRYFDSYEQARPHVEGLQGAVSGYAPGTLAVYVNDANLCIGFISLAEYTVRLERAISQLSDDIDRLTRSHTRR